jgi:hypothetical protein
VWTIRLTVLSRGLGGANLILSECANLLYKKLRIVLLVSATSLTLHAVPLHSQASTGERDVSRFPGRSIVEQIQAAIRDCGSNPCALYIPAGSYNASPVTTWQVRDQTGSSVGIPLPSNIEIRGAGIALTTIRVTLIHKDPPAIFFANTGQSNRNVRLRDMSILWTDSGATEGWTSIILCRACDHLELDHLHLEGNPNKLVNLLDSTASSIHDNDFLLHSTSYAHGDNALSISRFNPAIPVTGTAGVVRDNRFTESGDYRIFSLLIVAQSNLYVHDNVFEAHLPSGNATAIESGQDNLARLPENVRIGGNTFHGASIAYGGLNNSEIANNFFDHGDIYIALQSGTTASLSGLTISDNELHFGGISIAGLEHTFTGKFLITRNRVFDGSIGTGNSLTVQDIEVSYNSVRYSSNNNGIDCNACSVIKGNVVREIGQNAPGDVHAGYLIGGTVNDVSDNVYLDDQHEYDAGTICSVAKAASVVCLSSGASRWILLRGGEWGFGWTNRTLFTDRGNLLIHAFVNSSLLELDEDAPAVPTGSHYRLFHTTFNAFELNSATIERFANNMASASSGFRHAAIQENGTVRIRNLSGNVFHPYSCSGKCTADYRSTVSGPD